MNLDLKFSSNPRILRNIQYFIILLSEKRLNDYVCEYLLPDVIEFEFDIHQFQVVINKDLSSSSKICFII
jgi:hypothetical protein